MVHETESINPLILNSMKRAFFVVILVTIFTGNLWAQGKFEGKIVKKGIFQAEGFFKKQLPVLSGGQEDIVIVKGSKLLQLSAATNLLVLLDFDNKCAYNILPQKKVVNKIPYPGGRHPNDLFQKTDEKKEIEGLICTKYVSKVDNKGVVAEAENWIPDGVLDSQEKIDIYNYMFQGIDGFAMEAVAETRSTIPLFKGKFLAVTNTVRVDRTPVADSIFDIPSDYKYVNDKEFQKIWKKYVAQLNKERAKMDKNTELFVPENVWDF